MEQKAITMTAVAMAVAIGAMGCDHKQGPAESSEQQAIASLERLDNEHQEKEIQGLEIQLSGMLAKLESTSADLANTQANFAECAGRLGLQTPQIEALEGKAKRAQRLAKDLGKAVASTEKGRKALEVSVKKAVAQVIAQGASDLAKLRVDRDRLEGALRADTLSSRRVRILCEALSEVLSRAQRLDELHGHPQEMAWETQRLAEMNRAHCGSKDRPSKGRAS